MINNVNKNSYNTNLYGKSTLKSNDEINKTQNKLETTLNNNDLKKLNTFQGEEVGEFLNRIKEEIKNAELAAIKIVRGEELTPKEEKLIKEKYPELEQTAKEAKKECETLKKDLKNCKTDEARKELISNTVKYIKTMIKKGVLSELQSRIKLSGVEEAQKSFTESQKELNKAEIIAVKIIKGEKLTPKEQQIINQKFPEVKEMVEKATKQYSNLREQLKSCKTDHERQSIISNAIKDIKNLDKNNLISKTEVKVKIAVIEEIAKESKKVQLEDKKSEIIAMKVIKGEKLTPKEEKFINEKYPELKQIAKELNKECIDLKENIKKFDIKEEKQQVISKAVNDLESMNKNGLISKAQYNMNLLMLEEIKKEELGYLNKERKKLFNINQYLPFNLGLPSEKISAVIIVIVIIVILYII